MQKEKNLDAYFEEQLETSKTMIRAFIADACTEENAYKNIKNYEFLQFFSFDWLNYQGFVPLDTKEDTINSNFIHCTKLSKQSLKNFSTDKKYLAFPEFQNSKKNCKSDPDSMAITLHIYFVLYYEKWKKVYNNFYGETVPTIKNCILKDVPLFSGDTINSMHTYFGSCKVKHCYVEKNDVEKKCVEDESVFLIDKITSFNASKIKPKLQFTKDSCPKFFKKLLNFFNLYHTFGNFIPLPRQKSSYNTRTINQYRAHLDHDNFYCFLELLKQNWDVFKEENLSDLSKWDLKDNLNLDEKATTIWKSLFANNAFFFRAFDSFDDYCETFDIDYTKYFELQNFKNFSEKHNILKKYPKDSEEYSNAFNAYIEDLKKYMKLLRKIIRTRNKHLISKLQNALQD